ncbi:MAG: hypothetical protein PHC68_09210 [Syntrophorhabdaceae bacterium]|nr:hypothetical protein [Syntrophorhabdaceae bacterium]
MYFEFSELDIDTAATLRTVTFQAASPDEALENALYTARLKNDSACIGPTRRVIYPEGPDGNLAWVLKSDEYHRFWADKP